MNKRITTKFRNMPDFSLHFSTHKYVPTLIRVLNGRVWFLLHVCKFIHPVSQSALARIIYVPCFHLIISRVQRSKTE